MISLPVVRAGIEARPEPRVRGERILAAVDGVFVALDRAIQRVLPERWNPLAHTGAVSILSLFVAVVSGIPLLFWYVPSVHQAHASLEALSGIPQLVRSLHRYSSDLCVLFTGIHALRTLAARRFSGARWLAWVTGIVSVGFLWLVGWLGYWLVWDERAHEVVLGSSRLLDVLPVFAEPFSRSFLTDGSVKPLLFFIVFFLHMLLPLGMGVALWLHIARLARPRYLTRLGLGLGLLGFLVLVSLVVPATSVGPARMQVLPRALTIDAWFLWPLPFMDRLSGPVLWLGGVGLFVILLLCPWWLARGRARPAAIAASRCNACNQCVVDCPFAAIKLEPRSDGRPFPNVAVVDPGLCVACGICVGACDPGGPDLPDLPLDVVRGELDRALDSGSGDSTVVFGCARSAAGRMRERPDTIVVRVPCAGWVHPLLVERALRHGARGVVVVACEPGDPVCREGGRWTAQRMAGAREPKLRTDKIDAARVRVVELGPRAHAELDAALCGAGLRRPPRRMTRALAGGALVAAAGAATVLPSAAPLVTGRGGAELVVSFRSAGERGGCRKVSAEENATRPVHMRRAEICERGRAPVRLRVAVDGRLVLERAYGASGLFGDGESVAIARLPVAPGEHDVEVSIGETRSPDYAYSERRRLTFDDVSARVVLFEKDAGFHWQ